MSKKLSSVAPERQTVAGLSEDASDFEKVQWAISELEKRVRVNSICDIRKPVNTGLQNHIIKLIGTKPIVSCELEGKKSDALLDSGSQVSMCSSDWLSEHAPEAEIKPVTDFLEEGENVRFLAANNTEVPIDGAVILNFDLGGCGFPVPFVVTGGLMSQPIIGFNVMEHVVRSGNPDTLVSSLHHAMKVSVGAINVMVNLISQNFEDSDCLGVLKGTKNVVIPPKTVRRIKCRVKGDVRGADMSVICSAPLIGEWDEELEVTQSLGELVRGRTPNINIEIRNNASKAKEIFANMVVGEISAVNAVIPVNVNQMAAVDVESGSDGHQQIGPEALRGTGLAGDAKQMSVDVTSGRERGHQQIGTEALRGTGLAGDALALRDSSALSEDGEHVCGELTSDDDFGDVAPDVVATIEDLSEPPDPSVSEPESEPAGELSSTLLNDSLTGYESANETVSELDTWLSALE